MTIRVVILVPYRDASTQNRAAHLEYFLRTMPCVLDAALGAGTYYIMIGKQTDDGRLFSRGRVLNALAAIAMVKYPGARLVMHDVDLIPDEARASCYAAPMPDGVKALALHSDGEYAGSALYIGGICAVEPAVFTAVNGFDTRFEGWGGEDDAFRDVLLFFFGGNDRARFKEIVAAPTRGKVLNLEASESVMRGTLRASRDASRKMPKEKRHAIRDEIKQELARHGKTLHGLQQAVFYCPLATESGDACTIFDLAVFVTLPTGFRQWMSSTMCRPYYGRPDDDSKCTFALPPGTVVCDLADERARMTAEDVDVGLDVEDVMRRAVEAEMARMHEPPKKRKHKRDLKRVRVEDAPDEAAVIHKALNRHREKQDGVKLNTDALAAIFRES